MRLCRDVVPFLPISGVGCWEYREATRSARSTDPVTIHGRVADASVHGSAEDEGEEGEDQHDDEDQATAAGSATIDPALPLIPELAFALRIHDFNNAKRAAMSA